MNDFNSPASNRSDEYGQTKELENVDKAKTEVRKKIADYVEQKRLNQLINLDEWEE